MKRSMLGAFVGVALLSLLAVNVADAAEPALPNARGATAVVAFGRLQTASGETCRVYLRAATLVEDGRVRGGLRLHCPGDGVVLARMHEVSVANGVATVSGEGSSLRADGTRAHLDVTATITPDGKLVSIHLTGDGIDETVSGHLDPGVARAGERPLRRP